MRARLPRGSASSWSPSESTLKEIAGFVSAIGGCGENRFFPPELVRWIRDVKAETDSVYLVLNSDEDAYEYKIAPLDQAMRRDHFFTLSSRGVTEFMSGGDSRFVPLDAWELEYRRYQALTRVRFFKQFRPLRAFRAWRIAVRKIRIMDAKKKLKERSCSLGNNAHMRNCLVKVKSHLSQLCSMGVTEVSTKTTKHIKDFHDRQLELVEKFRENFTDFRTLLVKLVLDAAKATFTEAGFDYSGYAAELDAYSASALANTNPSSTLSALSFQGVNPNPPPKLTFIEQANKRQCCLRINSFIRLVDCLLRQCLHQVVYNSVVVIIDNLMKRSKSNQDEDEDGSGTSTRGPSTSQQKSGNKEELEQQQQVVPVFSLTVGVSQTGITYTPDISIFEQSFSNYLSKLNEAIAGVTPLMFDKAFRPFTQPILYKKLENYLPKVSSDAKFLSGHEERCNELLKKLNSLTVGAFTACQVAMSSYFDTALEFSKSKEESGKNQSIGKEEVIETEVEVLKAMLSKLQNQQASFNGIKDSRTVAFFKVDLRLLKRTVLPNVAAAITRLQESLPKVGREKMERFSESARHLRELTDFEPKTSADFVSHMDLAARLRQGLGQLEAQLASIERVYAIMAEIPVPVAADDRAALKQLRTTLASLAAKIDERHGVGVGVGSGRAALRAQLEREEKQLRDAVAEAWREARAPALLDAEASVEEVRPVLKKVEVTLADAREKAKRYNEYERRFGFPITEYFDLVAAERTLKALETLWHSCEYWDRLYDEWSELSFDLLDVDECQRLTEEMARRIALAQQVLGENDVASALRRKVETMLENIPCLRHLKSPSLRERHWRAIAEAVGVGADLRAGASKITLGLLEQSNALAAAAKRVAEVAAAAATEERLDGLMEELKTTWEGTPPPLKPTAWDDVSHLIDFPKFFCTVRRSLGTLRQLGAAAQYGIEMRQELLAWFSRIRSAAGAASTVRSAQVQWLLQEAPLSSLTTAESIPADTADLFTTTRSRLAALFSHMAANPTSVLKVFKEDSDLICAVQRDLAPALHQTRLALTPALCALRKSSPLLFFLSDDECLSLMFTAYKNIKAIEVYLGRIFPWFKSLLLEDGSEQSMSAKGYHPIVVGVTSVDGEQFYFSHPMTARLEADYWIKCIGISVKHTLRKHSISLNGKKPSDFWLDHAMTPVQIVIACAHAILCDMTDVDKKTALSSLVEKTVTNIEESSNLQPALRRREEVKLLFLHYQLEVLKRGWNLVRYSFDEARRVLKVDVHEKTYIYGYQYVGQGTSFTPDLLFDDAAYQILGCVYQKYTSCCSPRRSAILRKVSNLLGRTLRRFVLNSGQSLANFMVGAVATGSWLDVGPVENLTTFDLSFLEELLLKMRGLEVCGGSKLEAGGFTVDVSEGVHFSLSSWNSNASQSLTKNSRNIFRFVGLSEPPISFLLKSSLQQSSSFSESLFHEIVLILGKLEQVDVVQTKLIPLKMLLAVRMSEQSDEVYRRFLDLGARDVLIPAMPQLKKLCLPLAFMKELNRQVSLDLELEKNVSPGLKVPLENLCRLEKSLSCFDLSILRSCHSAVEEKSVNLLRAKFRQEKHVLLLEVSLETQWRDPQVRNLLLKKALESGQTVLIIYGEFEDIDYDLIVNCCFNRGIKILCLDLDSSEDMNIIRNECVNWVKMREDKLSDARLLLIKHGGDSVHGLTKGQTEYLAGLIVAVTDGSTLDHDKKLSLESVTITLSLMLAGESLACQHDLDDRETILAQRQHLWKVLVKALMLHLPKPKVRSLLEDLHQCHQHDLNVDESLDYDDSCQGEDANLRPRLSISQGDTDLFVPTNEIVRVVKSIRFCLERGISVFTCGESGVGKSIAIRKALEAMRTKPLLVKLHLGRKVSFVYEDNVLRQARLQGNSVVVLVEGFDPMLREHVSYAYSLIKGRTLYDHDLEDFLVLPKLVLCLETQLRTAASEVLSRFSPLRNECMAFVVRKPFDDDAHVLSRSLGIFGKDFSEEIQKEMPELKSFVVGWHKFARKQSALVSDHHLYRLISGLFLASPTEILTAKQMHKHLLNEIVAEYDVVCCKNIDDLLEDFSPYYRSKFFKDLGNEVSFLQTIEGEGFQLQMRPYNDVYTDFKREYEGLNASGNLSRNFDEKLSINPEFVQCVVGLLRSFHRYGSVAIVGPAGGVGKRSCIKFFARIVGIDQRESFPSDEPDTDKVLSAFTGAMKECFLDALNSKERLLYVKVDENRGGFDILTQLEDLLFYCDTPVFSQEERTKQTFATEEDEYEALCNEEFHRQAMAKKQLKVRQNLHLILDMTPSTFKEASTRHGQLFARCGTVRLDSWSEETLRLIAKDRLNEANDSAEVPVEKVSKILTHIHLDACKRNPHGIHATQFLDAVTMFPGLYLPLLHKLKKAERNYSMGIQNVNRSQEFIEALSKEMAQLDPLLVEISSETESLHNRLAQERMNLDKASKAFRRKELAARKKSDETQELAADAHRNLEHALPSWDAAIMAVAELDRTELVELKTKGSGASANVEIIQQVMEAVCVLLGTKADWTTAKAVLADPQLQQRLIDYDKDNISEQVSKRIRRYIENPRFVPDEASKASRAAAALCMWVRALDLYGKVFQSIEPKRIKLLQTESELAELMSALREETDRVAHTEAAIASVQAALADVGRRRQLAEATQQRTAERLERARILAYSLEEERRSWSKCLQECTNKRELMTGAAVLACAAAVYHDHPAFESWEATCTRFGVPVGDDRMIRDFLESKSKVVDDSWLADHETFLENYLAIMSTSKWTIVVDPHGLALTHFQSRNPALLAISMQDPDMAAKLERAVSVGTEVAVVGFAFPYPAGLRHLFERRFQERGRAYVGVIGLPIMRRDLRVRVMDKDITCHENFVLHLVCDNLDALACRSKRILASFNVVYYDFTTQSLQARALSLIMDCVSFTEAHRYKQIHLELKNLESLVNTRREAVLAVLLGTGGGEAMLDSHTVVAGLKEAKAKVYEAQNELELLRKETSALRETTTAFVEAAERLSSFSEICSKLRRRDPSFDFTPNYVHNILKNEHYDIKSLVSNVIEELVEDFLLSLHKDLRKALCVFSMLVQRVPREGLQRLLEKLDIFLTKGEEIVGDQEVLVAAARQVEAAESEIIFKLMKASAEQPVLLLVDESSPGSYLHPVDLVYRIAKCSGNSDKPKLIQIMQESSISLEDRIRTPLGAARQAGRWAVVNGATELLAYRLAILGPVSCDHRVFVVCRHGQSMGEGLRSSFKLFSVNLPDEVVTRRKILLEIMKDLSPRNDLDTILKLHLEVSEQVGVLQSFKCLEILAAKTGSALLNLKKSSPELSRVVQEVYGDTISAEKLKLLLNKS